MGLFIITGQAIDKCVVEKNDKRQDANCASDSSGFHISCLTATRVLNLSVSLTLSAALVPTVI